MIYKKLNESSELKCMTLVLLRFVEGPVSFILFEVALNIYVFNVLLLVTA